MPAYTVWWLREHAFVDGRRLGEYCAPAAEPALQELFPALAFDLDPALTRALGLPSALTYAINAVGQGEGFYLMVAMPPNEIAISKVTWVSHFGRDCAHAGRCSRQPGAQVRSDLVGYGTRGALDRHARCVLDRRRAGQPREGSAPTALPGAEHVLHERAEAGGGARRE